MIRNILFYTGATILLIALIFGCFYFQLKPKLEEDAVQDLIKKDLCLHYDFEPVYWEFTKIEFEEKEGYLIKVYTYEQTGGPHSVHPVEWKFFARIEEKDNGTVDVDTEEIYTRERLYK